MPSAQSGSPRRACGGSSPAACDPFIHRGFGRGPGANDQMNVLPGVIPGMLVKPQFGADEESYFGLVALNPAEIVLAALIPGCFPETFLIGQVVFVVGSPIARSAIPAKALV